MYAPAPITSASIDKLHGKGRWRWGGSAEEEALAGGGKWRWTPRARAGQLAPEEHPVRQADEDRRRCSKDDERLHVTILQRLDVGEDACKEGH